MNIIELKARAFDLIAQRDQINAELNQVVAELNSQIVKGNGLQLVPQDQVPNKTEVPA